jgi:hypothetical protein
MNENIGRLKSPYVFLNDIKLVFLVSRVKEQDTNSTI